MRSQILAALGAGFLFVGSAGAQTPPNDPSERLREVLPADVADKILATIAVARAHELPAQALEQRALKFAAKGVEPKLIARSITAQAVRMGKTKDALSKSLKRKPADDEIEAGAEAIRQGVDGVAVSELAKSAPSGRSLAVPLFVIGNLVDRGLPSDEALSRVVARLQARASDREIETLSGNRLAEGDKSRPTTPGNPATPAKPPGVGGGTAAPTKAGPPAGVPANGGKGASPTTPPARGKK
ncbi:MAG TPA: hypothetical protein VHM24_10595 [Gemmatimonadaceae bacterium]|nr:hypothetical protein [Gemmatimonadaceae bacterium]